MEMIKKPVLEWFIIGNLVKNYLKLRNIVVHKIIIFGSFTKGKQNEITSGLNRVLVKKFNIPFDIIYYSDEEWKYGELLIIQETK